VLSVLASLTVRKRKIMSYFRGIIVLHLGEHGEPVREKAPLAASESLLATTYSCSQKYKKCFRDTVH
jgi:hypothetical protein